MKSKTRTWVLIGLLVGLHLMIVFAGFINPYDPAAQNRDFPYAPPVRVHFVDARGFHLRPFVYLQAADGDGYREDLRQAYPVHFLKRGSAYRILGVFNSNLHLLGVDEPARIFLLGTDAYGRDEFSRLLQGGQISLAAGLLATLLSLVAATLIGTISGYYGKWIDESLMGSAELFLSLPWLYFLLMVRALLPLHVSPTATFMLLIAVIGLIGWARPARLVRGIWRIRFLPLAASHPAANSWGLVDPGYVTGSAICRCRGDPFVLRVGSQRTDAKLGQHAERAPAI
jgi:peptide/nickel transport system permease protein